MNISSRVPLLLLVAVATGCGGGGDSDAGPTDARVPGLDGSTLPDGGAADAGLVDSGPPDAGTSDSGAVDAGTTDAGADPDAGLTWPDPSRPAPDWVDLTVGPVGSCPALTPCGGDIVGTWDLSGGCFEVDIESAISSCPGAMVTRREGRGRGRVRFESSGAAHRVAESVVETDLFFPAVCAAFFSCSMLEDAMRGLVDEASCTADSTGNCECTASLSTVIDDMDTYSTMSNEIVGGFSGKRWEYCVDGEQLRYRDSSATEPREPGTVTLRRL
ncbi:MAG: hypothetical protein AB8I08_03220 [Sandaracinaceae bacterium]